MPPLKVIQYIHKYIFLIIKNKFTLLINKKLPVNIVKLRKTNLQGGKNMKTSINRRKNIKFSEWIDIWLQNERPFIKESTYATYTNIIENHINPSLGTKNINNIKFISIYSNT